MRLDAVIFGGGVAGLWLLDELRGRGCSAILLEAGALGAGQTVASQGIIHGGLKYTLSGILTRSAANISEMPLLWRDCFAGRRAPDLSQTTIRSQSCYLWRSDSISSRLGMIGARVGLRVAPKILSRDQCPEFLADCPGSVARLEEQVISPAALLKNLQDLNREVILKYDPNQGFKVETDREGNVSKIRLTEPHGQVLELEPETVIFTAGRGNESLRNLCGLEVPQMQVRPLHMLMVRGDLPELTGHCVDGAKTRVTITSDRDSAGRVVWQVGGQISEDGVQQSRAELIEAGRRELKEVLPNVSFDQAEFGNYRVDRAEPITPGGKRPETFRILHERNILTCWPTKLVLAPILAQQIAAQITPVNMFDTQQLAAWPRPEVASPPWERRENWDEQETPLRKSA